MSITFHSDGSIVHLTNGTISYVIELLDHTYLLHRYFGQAIRAWHGTGVTIPSKRSYTTEYADGTQNLYFDALPFEYPPPRPRRLPSACADRGRAFRSCGGRSEVLQLAGVAAKAQRPRLAHDLLGTRRE